MTKLHIEFEPSRTKSERAALGVFALLALFAMAWVSHTVAVGIFLGMLTAFMFEPVAERMNQRLHRPALARALCIIAAGLAIILLVAGISFLLVDRGIVIGKAIVDALQPGGDARASLDAFAAHLEPYDIHVAQFADKARAAATSVARFAAEVAATIAARTFNVLLMIFFMLLTMHFVLAHWTRLTKILEALLPLTPSHTRALVHEFHEAGRVSLLGSVVTGLAQGLLAGLVYWASGVPEAAFFGAITAVASLIPGVGTLLVWLPVGLFMIVVGHPVRGALEIFSAALLVVGFCDYVLRPRLVGGESMPALLTFAAIFGGVEAFGLIGLLLGPLLMSVAVALLRIYIRDSEPAV